jgi:hypothetical protein
MDMGGDEEGEVEEEVEIENTFYEADDLKKEGWIIPNLES